jgi:L-lactate dehydrogenase complex protein LldG
VTSRDKILAAIQQNQPAFKPLPDKLFEPLVYEDALTQFTNVLQGIGGKVARIASSDVVADYLAANYTESNHYVTTIPILTNIAQVTGNEIPHDFNTVEVAVIAGQFGVAENGAVWVTEEQLKVRALPFIAQNLVILLHESQLVHNMQQAYDRIGQANYGYGVFIAGPSKTADIEQSLVLGAHGAKSLTILIHP